MASQINASNSGFGGIVSTGDSSGVLELQTTGTTAVTIDTSQRVGFVAGTAAAPAITRTGDTNTGIFFPAADTIAFAEGGTEAMRIDSSGNVGIGTTSPAANLDVSGTGAKEIRITSDTSGNARIGFNVVGSVYAYWEADRASGAMIYNNGTERMRIKSDGSVWFGGSVTSDSPAIFGKGGAANMTILEFRKQNSGATNVMLNYYQSNYVGGMNMDNTSTSFPTSSDVRLKKDIVNAPSATQKIDSIRIVSHGWKHDEAVVDFGIIAQELYEIMPRAVTKGDDNEEVETVWSVDYSKLVPMLIKAHQEQQELIKQLQADVAELKGKI